MAMKSFFKTFLYLVLASSILWLSHVALSLIIAFSHTDHVLSWIPYIILGGWVPGKWYGLTLLHSIFCVAISISVIGFLDRKLDIGIKPRMAILIIISSLFLYEGISNFFLHGDQEIEILQFRQFALIQLSFLIGILIKTFNPDAEMN